MRPGAMVSLWRALAACSGPARVRISGMAPVLCGDRCSTTNREPGKSSGRPPTSRCNPATPPAEAPITKMSRTGMTDTSVARRARHARTRSCTPMPEGWKARGARTSPPSRLSSRTASASEPIRDPSIPACHGATPGYMDPGSRASRSAGMTAARVARHTRHPSVRSDSVFREGGELVRLRRVAQLAERLGLDLADTLAGDAEHLSDLLERMVGHAADAEAHAQDLLLARRELGERLGDRLRQRAALGRGVRIGRVRRLDQVAQGGVAVLADGQVERYRILHHGQDLLDTGDRNARARRHFRGAGIAPFLLVELAPLAQHLGGGLRHVHGDADGAALVGDGARHRLADPPHRI